MLLVFRGKYKSPHGISRLSHCGYEIKNGSRAELIECRTQLHGQSRTRIQSGIAPGN
jgi:hypothetical protein